jgi:ferric-dicitrate binding protein FerR (iron transport regulator)
MDRATIIALLEKHANGTLSPEEEGIFRHWLEQAGPDEFHRLLDQAVKVPAIYREYPDIPTAFAQRLEQGLDDLDARSKPPGSQKLRPVPPDTSGRLFPFRLRWAAAVLLLLTSTYIIYRLASPSRQAVTPSTAQPSQPISQDIAPGGNKAILTLASGRTILLDSTSNGLISQQGDARITKMANGQLAVNAPAAGQDIVYNSIATPNGGRYQIDLPDGSRVWLNAASSLRFPNAFAGNERLVELTGEGYFEIAPNAARPFRVKTRDAVIEVLGTHFNINAYNDEADMKTTLLTGSVRVKGTTGAALLAPGQQLHLEPSGGMQLDKEADTEQAIAWKNGYFQFDGADLPALMRQLARWYNVQVVYEGKVGEHAFTGKIARDVNLSTVVNALQLNNVHCKITGNKLVVIP